MFKTFNNKNFGDYHDLYAQGNVLLLADVFENFRNQCLKTYHLDPGSFLTLPSLAWQACLKVSNVQLDLIINSELLLMTEEAVKGGITQVITKFSEANKNTWKTMIKIKTHHSFNI